MTILITGATGFIGSALAQYLAERGNKLHLVARLSRHIPLPNSRTFSVGDIHTATDWKEALAGVETLIHTAGIVHNRNMPAEKYLQTNVEATRHLAEMAGKAGVKHFIFLSSAGVHGRVSNGDAFVEISPYAPYSDYSSSKQRAEEALLSVCKNFSMAFTIIRPPLVYAAQAPGNFGRLLQLVAQGIPLPLGSLKNARSIVALENLLHFIDSCIKHSQAQAQIFLVADPQPVSTRQIVQWLAQGMNKNAHLLPIPPKLVYWMAKLLQQEEKYQQLCGDLIIDTGKAQSLLGWQAPLATETAVVKAGQEFMSVRSSLASRISHTG